VSNIEEESKVGVAAPERLRFDSRQMPAEAMLKPNSFMRNTLDEYGIKRAF
jgi:hypothetical protein